VNSIEIDVNGVLFTTTIAEYKHPTKLKQSFDVYANGFNVMINLQAQIRWVFDLSKIQNFGGINGR